ncbi:MAG: YcxB family protein [Clostridia bacterium]|nr:YcxB family protein [Clostridia bacterium]
MEEKANFELMGAAVGPRFTVRSKAETKDIVEFIKSSSNAGPRKYMAIPIIFGVIWLAAFAVDALTGRSPSYYYPILALICYVYFEAIIPWINERNAAKTELPGDMDTYLFFEDRLFYSEEGVDANALYSKICKVRESENLFLIYVTETRAHLIKKEAIEGGDIDAFRALISEKAGREVRFVSAKIKPSHTVRCLIAAAVIAAVVVGCLLIRNSI